MDALRSFDRQQPVGSVGGITAAPHAGLVSCASFKGTSNTRGSELDERLTATLPAAIERFTRWLEAYGPTSYDHQSYFAGPVGGRAKALYYRQRALGTLAVAPMILSEAFFPAGRRLFGPKLRFP